MRRGPVAEAERIPASVFAAKPATFLEKVYREKITLVLTWYGKERAKVVPVEKGKDDDGE